MKRFGFVVLAGLFLTGGIYTTRTMKEKSITGLTNTEMREIYAGVTCGGACVDNGASCSNRSCSPEGSVCSFCSGSNFKHQTCTSLSGYSCKEQTPSPTECGMLLTGGKCEKEGIDLKCHGGSWDMQTMCSRDRRDGGTCPWLR